VDPFAAILFGGIAVFVLWVVVLGRYVPGNGLEQLGLRSGPQITERREALEAEDLAQMVAAHNRRRAARGEPALSADQVEMRVLSENAQQRQRDRAEAERRRAERSAQPQPGAEDAQGARERELAQRELEELLEATNARRRARGLPERTAEQAQREFGGK
jgi:hypothetical protein